MLHTGAELNEATLMHRHMVRKKLLALGVKKRVVHQVWPRLVHQGLDDG
jgi:hypothetical protein